MIIAASSRFEQSLRFGDTEACLGDDKFAILLEEAAATGDAKNIMESLQKTLSVLFTLRGKKVLATA